MTTTEESKTKKPKYTWEVVTRAVRGKFLIGDREFIDQPFTRAERARLLDGVPEGSSMLAVMIAALNLRHSADHQTPVTQEWVDEQLSDDDLNTVVAKMSEMTGIVGA